jgi:hypothetical protein
MLGYGGHCLTKSRMYSVAFGQLRRARADHTRAQHHPDGERDPSDRPVDETVVLIIRTFDYAGSEHIHSAGSQLALYTVPGGWRGYVWVTGPDGTRRRKYVKATTYEDCQQAWLKLRAQAARGPVATNLPKLGDYLNYWLSEIIKPDHAPKTYERYEMFVRLHITPYLGGKRLDKLTPRDIRTWINRLRETCQCCAQGKDARRPEGKRDCCAVGRCCRQPLRPFSAPARRVARVMWS